MAPKVLMFKIKRLHDQCGVEGDEEKELVALPAIFKPRYVVCRTVPPYHSLWDMKSP